MLPYDVDHARRHLEAQDRRLGKLIQKVGPFTMQLMETADVFQALARSIVYQQLNGRAAATIFGRVQDAMPGALLTPENVQGATDEVLRAAGLSANKLRALRDLTEKTLGGHVPALPHLHTMEDDAIVERLTVVRGIGRWTVEMLLIFRLGRPDVLPVDDYGVRKGFARILGKKELPTPKELLAYGEKWRPFRSVASWYLWRAAEAPEKPAAKAKATRATKTETKAKTEPKPKAAAKAKPASPRSRASRRPAAPRAKARG